MIRANKNILHNGQPFEKGQVIGDETLAAELLQLGHANDDSVKVEASAPPVEPPSQPPQAPQDPAPPVEPPNEPSSNGDAPEAPEAPIKEDDDLPPPPTELQPAQGAKSNKRR